jgi:pimeloyl-ACP methyl ester carboxylesterase
MFRSESEESVVSTEIKPFRVEVPQSRIDELNERLDRTILANEIPGSGSTYGISVDWVDTMVRKWRQEFDWRAVEARLNQYPQFTTEIDGQQIHFLHVRSGRPDALGLVLTHGWPGSVLEYLEVIAPLTDAGYDVVIPSLPGFGFSGPTRESGWDVHRTARAWVELMRRLGYERYGAVGNDGGSMISPEVGRLDAEHVVGVHVTQLFSFPTGDPAELADLTADEQAAMEHLAWFWENMGAFNVLQSQAPQTLAHALADSPAGLVGWNGQLLQGVDDDFALANIALYWFTGTSGSSIRFYYEMAKSTTRSEGPTTVPIALASSTNDFQSIRRFAERDHANIASWNVYDAGGHYTAHTDPALLAKDVTSFFGSL